MFTSTLEAICADAGWRYDPALGEVEVDLADGRKQSVMVSETTLDDGPYLRLVSVIGPSEALDRQRSQAALRLNASLCHGAFAIVGDDLAVLDLIPAIGDVTERLWASLAYVAKTADRYEQVVFGTDQH